MARLFSQRTSFAIALLLTLAPAGLAQQPPVDFDRDGYPAPLDCQDRNPFVNPRVNERCNGLDDDCDGALDPGCPCVRMLPPPPPNVLAELDANTAGASAPVLVWTGFEAQAHWPKTTRILGEPVRLFLCDQRLRRTGRPVTDAVEILVGENTRTSYVSAAWAGDGAGAAADTKFVPVDRKGEILAPPSPIAEPTAPFPAWRPFLAWSGDRFGAVWTEMDPWSSRPQRVLFRELGRLGEPLAEPTIVNDSSESYLFVVAKGLAASAQSYGVVLSTGAHLFSAIAREAGVASEPARVNEVGEDVGGASAGVVFNGQTFAVIWIGLNQDGSGWGFRVREMSENGQPAGPIVNVQGLIPRSGYEQFTVAWTGDRYAVAWTQRLRNGGGSEMTWEQLLVATFSRSGQLIDPPLVLEDVEGEPSVLFYGAPGIVWTGHGYIVARTLRRKVQNREFFEVASTGLYCR